MRVIEPGDHRASLQVDDLRVGATHHHDLRIVADQHKTPLADRHSGGLRLLAVYRVQAAVMQNQLSGDNTLSALKDGSGCQGGGRVHRPGGTQYGTGGDKAATAFLVFVHGGSLGAE
ncbi:hypothetical protein D3C80_715160 [compost metagenome]